MCVILSVIRYKCYIVIYLSLLVFPSHINYSRQTLDYYFGLLQDKAARYSKANPMSKKQIFFSSVNILQYKNVGFPGPISRLINKKLPLKVKDKIDPFLDVSKIFFPINIESVHWALIVAFMDQKEVIYFIVIVFVLQLILLYVSLFAVAIL